MKECKGCAYKDEYSETCLRSYNPDGKYVDPSTRRVDNFLCCCEAATTICNGTQKYFSERSPYRDKVSHLFTRSLWKIKHNPT